MANFELVKKDATGYSRIDTRHPDFDIRDSDTAEVLWNLFRKRAKRLRFFTSFNNNFGVDEHMFEDIANEMYLMCLQNDKREGIACSQFLSFEAMRRVFGDPRYKNQASCLEYLPDFCEDTTHEKYEDTENTTIANKFILELDEENLIIKERCIPYLKENKNGLKPCDKKLTSKKQFMLLEWVSKSRPFILNRRIFAYINKEARRIEKITPIPGSRMYRVFYSYALIDFPRSTLELVTDRTEEIQRFVSDCRADTLYCLDRDYANLICKLEKAVLENQQVHECFHKVKQTHSHSSHAT